MRSRRFRPGGGICSSGLDGTGGFTRLVTGLLYLSCYVFFTNSSSEEVGEEGMGDLHQVVWD